MAESKIAEFKMAAIINLSENAWVKFFCANGWIQDGRIQDGCHHQVESEWMSLIQIELDWVRVLCNMTEYKQDGRIQDGCHHLVSQIELVWVRVRVEGECFWVNLWEDNKVSESKMAVSESNMAEFRMAAIIKLSQNEWVKVFFVQIVETNVGKCEWVREEKLRWLNPRWSNSRWLPSSS